MSSAYHEPRTAPPGGPEGLIPGGLEPPPLVEPAIFQGALVAFLAERRLDMQALAADLGISRATLYRRVGDRDTLLGQVLWFLTRHAMARALETTAGMRGAERVLAVTEAFMRDVLPQPALQRFLHAEPEAALRILTSAKGPVQSGIVGVLAALLRAEGVRTRTDPDTLAYALVRIGEGFMYADVIAALKPDVGKAMEIARLLVGAR